MPDILGWRRTAGRNHAGTTFLVFLLPRKTVNVGGDVDIVDNLAKEVVRDPGAMDLESVGVAKLSRGIKTNERSNCSEHSTRKG